MSWWLWVIVALAVYVLISITPWIVLQIALWRRRRSMPLLAETARRLELLMALEREHAERWPLRPRPGRYQEVDEKALEQLQRMRVIISQVNDLWPTVAGYTPPSLEPRQVLALGAWRPMQEALRIFRARRRFHALLDEGDEAIAALLEQWATAQAIPGRIQAEISEARAEARRLRALWESEGEAGTRGIEALGEALSQLEESLSEALDCLRDASAEQTAAAALSSEQTLHQSLESLHSLEQELEQVIASRLRAAESLEETRARLGSLAERWQELQARGAREPSVAARLMQLRQMVDALAATAQAATPEAYAQVTNNAEEVLALAQSLDEQIDALEDAMARSSAALEGDVTLLAAAQESFAVLQNEAGFAPDASEALIAQAQEIYAQAEEQHALGTLHSYQTALSLAEQAQQTVQAAQEQAEAAAQDLAQIEAYREQAAPEVRQALRERAESVSQVLQTYAQHWNEDCEARLERIYGLLRQIDQVWADLPPALLGADVPRQSQLASGRDALRNAAAAVRRARQLVEELEGLLARRNAQRQTLEAGLAELEGALGQRLAEAHESMLPELRERYVAWRVGYEARLPGLQDPAQINYDEAADGWLPTVLQEAREILAAHEEDIARYAQLLSDAQKRLERDWQRLQKLDPLQKPLPEEDVAQLAADYAAWLAEAETSHDAPALAAELVGRRMVGLERRIEAARHQINEGRQALATLDRQFEQQTRAIQKSRASVHALLQDSQWRQIDWPLADGEPWVQRALTYQQASREAETLDEAMNQMHRALDAAQQALQAYQGMEQQLRSAQERLNREFRAATAELDRAQRQTGQLRAQGPSEVLTILEEHCAVAQDLISMSQNASTFEEALRYLLDAQERLARS